MFTKTAAFYDAIYSFKNYPEEAAKVRGIILERRPDAKTLLDVACGTGAHLQELQKDFVCDGLDLDTELLKIARERLPEVKFHEGNMTDFSLGKTFDAVTCLFSAIGYAETVERLNTAVVCMAAHLKPGGVLIIEPWLTPESFVGGGVYATFVDEPELKIARINTSERDGSIFFARFEYLIGTPDGVERMTEDHRLGMFTHDEYLAAFQAARLEVEFDEKGLIGRGLYIGTKA